MEPSDASFCSAKQASEFVYAKEKRGFGRTQLRLVRYGRDLLGGGPPGPPPILASRARLLTGPRLSVRHE